MVIGTYKRSRAYIIESLVIKNNYNKIRNVTRAIFDDNYIKNSIFSGFINK